MQSILKDRYILYPEILHINIYYRIYYLCQYIKMNQTETSCSAFFLLLPTPSIIILSSLNIFDVKSSF